MSKIFTWSFIALIACFSVAESNAQASWQWGKRGGSGGSDNSSLYEHVIDMATDRNGNVYVLALNASGLANIDGHTGVSVRDKLSIASWSCQGSFRWMKSIGGANPSSGRAIGVDTVGGVYVTGQTFSNNPLAYSYFDTDTTLPNIAKRIYIVKYDTGGNFKWLKMPEPDTVTITNQSRPLDISVAPNGDIYWYACLAPGNYAGSSFTIATKKYYVIRFNNAGIYQQTIPLDMATTDGGNGANIDGITNAETSRFAHDHKTGRFYLSGQFNKDQGTLSFGATAVTATTAIGALPVYMAAFNSAGTSLWVKQSAPGLYAAVRNCRPATDGNGHVFLGGDAYPGNSFGGYTFTNSMGVSVIPFVIAMDSAGNNVWASNGINDNAVSGYGLAYANNTIAITGHYGGILKWGNIKKTSPSGTNGANYIYLARLNATTGKIIGLDSIRSQNTLKNYASALTADKNGKFYVGGRFDDRLYPGGDTIVLTGGTYDWFVAKFGTAVCNCTVPVVSFNSSATGSTWSLNYTGTAPVDSVVWEFGDGSKSTGIGVSHAYTASGKYTVCATAYNSCGSNNWCKTINAFGVGISTLPGFADATVYPNPVSDLLHIDNAGDGTTLQLFNTLGQEVLHTKLTGAATATDVSRLAAGVYILQLTGKDYNKISSRIIIR